MDKHLILGIIYCGNKSILTSPVDYKEQAKMWHTRFIIVSNEMSLCFLYSYTSGLCCSFTPRLLQQADEMKSVKL